MKYLRSIHGRDRKSYVEAMKIFDFKLLTLDDLQDIEIDTLMRSRYDQFSVDLYEYNA